MKVFIFDTETTGFTQRDRPLEEQPHIVQFAGIMIDIQPDGTYQEIDRVNELVKPPVSIPFGASQVHGIYDKDVVDELPISQKVDVFLRYLNGAHIVLGHNIEYDETVINYELERLGRKGDYQPQNIICTMKDTVDFCQIPGRGIGYKYPKLNELYKKLFGEHFEGAHDAMVDVEATLKAFAELVKRGELRLQTSEVMRLF